MVLFTFSDSKHEIPEPVRPNLPKILHGSRMDWKRWENFFQSGKSRGFFKIGFCSVLLNALNEILENGKKKNTGEVKEICQSENVGTMNTVQMCI